MTEPIPAKDATMSQEKEPKTPAAFTARSISPGPQGSSPAKAHWPHSLNSARSDSNSTSRPALGNTELADTTASNIINLKPVLQRVPESWMQEQQPPPPQQQQQQQQQQLYSGRHLQAPPPSPRAPVATSPRAVGLPNTVQARSAVAIQRFAAALDAAGLADPVVRALAVNYTARTRSSSVQEDEFAGQRPAASTPDCPASGSSSGVKVAQITSSLLITAGPAAATAAVSRGSGTPGGPAGVTGLSAGAAAARHYRGHTVPASSFGKPGLQYRAAGNSAYMSSSSNPHCAGPAGQPLAEAAAAVSARDLSSSATAPSTPGTPATAAVAIQKFAANASKAGLAHAEFMAIAATASSGVEGADPVHSSSNSSCTVKAGTKGPLDSMLFTESSAASSSMIKSNSSNQAMGYSAAGTVAPLLRTSDYGTYNNTGRKYGGSDDGSVGVYGRRSPSTRSESCDGSNSAKPVARAEIVSITHAGSTWGHHKWHPIVTTRSATASAEDCLTVSPALARLPIMASVASDADSDSSTGSVSSTAVRDDNTSAAGSVARLHVDSCKIDTTSSSAGGGSSTHSSSSSRHARHCAAAADLGVHSTRSVSSAGSHISNASSGTTFSSRSSSSLRQLNIERAMLPVCTYSGRVDPQQRQTGDEIQPEQNDSLALEAAAEPDALGEPQFWLSPIVASAARTSGGCSQLLSNQSCQSTQGSIVGDQGSLHAALRNRKASTLQSAEWASAMSYLGSDTSSTAAAAALPAVQQRESGAGCCEQQQHVERKSTAGAAVAAAGAAAAAALGSLRSMIVFPDPRSSAALPAAEAASLPIQSPSDATDKQGHTNAAAAVGSVAQQQQQQPDSMLVQLQQPEAALRQRITHQCVAAGNAARMHWMPVGSSDGPGSPGFSTTECASTLDQTGACGSVAGSAQEPVARNPGWNLNRMFLCGSAPDCGREASTDAAVAKQGRAPDTGGSKPCSKAAVLLMMLLILVVTAGAGVGIYFGARYQSKAPPAAASHHAASPRAVAAGNVVGVAIAGGEGGIGNPAYGGPVRGPTTTAAGTTATPTGGKTPAVAGVQPMNFQVVLAVPAVSAPEACAIWFNGTERLSLYKHIFSAAYTKALHVPVLETSISSIACDSRSVYNSSGAPAAAAATAAAAGTAPTTQQRTSTAAAPGITSALPQAHSVLVNSTRAAAAAVTAAGIGAAGMRISGPSGNQTAQHNMTNQKITQDVDQATLVTDGATVQTAGSDELQIAQGAHLQSINHTVQLPENRLAPTLTKDAAQEPITAPQQLAAGNAIQQVQIDEGSLMARKLDTTDAASTTAAAAATSTSALATPNPDGAPAAEGPASAVPAAAQQLQTRGSSALAALAAAEAAENTTAAVEAPATEAVTASSAIPLYLAATAAADNTTAAQATVLDSAGANSTARMRSLLQISDSSMTLVEVVTQFSMAAPSTHEERARVVEAVVTSSSAILSEPLGGFFREPAVMLDTRHSSRQGGGDHKIPSKNQPQQQLPAQKWIIPTVSYSSAPTCLFNLTKENSLQDDEGRLWSIMDGKQCVFRPQANIPRPEVKTYAWTTAPICAGQATDATSVADDSGRLWGWQNGSSCAFRQTKQQQGTASAIGAAATTMGTKAAGKQERPVKLSLVWDAAPACSFAPTKSNAVPDTYGRLWSWENDRSCAFKWQSLPDSLQLPT